jgi:hypothetical protein
LGFNRNTFYGGGGDGGDGGLGGSSVYPNMFGSTDVGGSPAQVGKDGEPGHQGLVVLRYQT